MKTTILLIIVVFILLIMAETSIHFHPFRITFSKLHYAIGFLFILIGIGFIQYQSRHDGLKEGAETVIKIIIDESKNPIQ